SNLLLHLQNNNGSISTQASKIGYMINFRKNNISFIAVLPAFTQCYDDRQDPNAKEWFVARDGFSYTPDFLNFDERIPNLIPYLDYNKLMNISSVIHHNGYIQIFLERIKKH
ncbi:unnamed protein product, partial [Adineta steineri]